jgi:hypothetical protein
MSAICARSFERDSWIRRVLPTQSAVSISLVVVMKETTPIAPRIRRANENPVSAVFSTVQKPGGILFTARRLSARFDRETVELSREWGKKAAAGGMWGDRQVARDVAVDKDQPFRHSFGSQKVRTAIVS